MGIMNKSSVLCWVATYHITWMDTTHQGWRNASTSKVLTYLPVQALLPGQGPGLLGEMICSAALGTVPPCEFDCLHCTHEQPRSASSCLGA